MRLTTRLLLPLLAAELNVRQIEFAKTGDALVTLRAKANFRSLGRRFGKKTPLAAAAEARRRSSPRAGEARAAGRAGLRALGLSGQRDGFLRFAVRTCRDADAASLVWPA